jgi:Fic family protein
LAHAQFESIHPFLDGNGRVGRLLITFLLCERKTLHRPLLDYLFEQPIVTVSMVKARLGCTFPTAGKLIAQYVEHGLLGEITGRPRNRRFRYDSYLALFESPGTTEGADHGDDQ